MKSKKPPKALSTLEQARALVEALEALGISDFFNYLHSPWKIIWYNFLAGIFRGLGIVVGMTVVFAFLIWLLSNLVNFPLLGQYFWEMKELLEDFSQSRHLVQ